MAKYTPTMEDKIEPIAIVGMSCRFPGEASSTGGLWNMMSNARTGHGKIPADRFNADTWYHPNHDRRGAINVKHGFFLEEDLSLFDAPFFSITAKEASGMDPMQRLLLEVSYETFENAGVPADQLVGSKTSVFCGCFTGDYDLLSNHDIFDHAPNAATGTGRAMLSNRVSWFFDLRGASFTVDTACSSSLYALHSACQSLRLGESKQALVTGSNLVLYPSMMHSLTNMHFTSPEGICHSFDDRANGYARGEAVGGLLLKPLKDAIRDGDTIRAVIRGSGANQDGKTPGITQPSPESQADLIRFCYEEAGLDFNDTGYFEAHGTGTALGDPMELSAIGNTFGKTRDLSKQPPLYVGSIKTNIGHTEGCSGLAGVIKSILCLEKGMIPPVAQFETLNPKLRLDDWKLALPLSTIPWPSQGLRRISVNSFGYGGANAHVVLDDAYHYMKSRNLIGNHTTTVDEDSGSDSGVSVSGPQTPDEKEDATVGKKKLLVFSTQDQAGLQRLASTYKSAFDSKLETKVAEVEDSYLDDLAYTLATHRTKFDYRSFAVSDSVSTLSTSLAKGLPKLKRAARDDNIMWVFTGQGAQWPEMGRQLLVNPVFRETMVKSQEYLAKYGAQWNVFEELEKVADSRIDLPEFSQPICSVLQISLVEMLRSWGVAPKATVGHSSGEIGAAYAAGYLSHEDSIKIAYWRGVYSGDVSRRLGDRKGIMMAAGVSEADAQEYLKHVPEGSAVVACINSPSSVTLSGDVSAISELETILNKDGKFARKLRVKTAYHSPHMQVIADDYLKAMGEVKPLSGNGAVMYSSVSGKVAASKEFDASYWVRNMTGAVRFLDAVSGILTHSNSKGRRKTPIKWSGAIELGPHEALKGPVNQIMAHVDSKLSSNVTYCALVLRGKDAETTALEAAGLLWSTGHSIDLAKVNGQSAQLANNKVLSDLPKYPWNHSKGFWYEPRMTTNKRFKKEPRTDLLGAPIDNQNNLEPHWRNILRMPENPWMEHHEITGTVLYPGAGMIVMAVEAARQLADPARALKGIELNDVTFGRGLVIPSGDEFVETSLSLRPHKSFPNCFNWTLYSLPHATTAWTENSSGLVTILYKDEDTTSLETEWQHQTALFEKCKDISNKKVNIEKFYKDLASIGMNYGPMFQNLTESVAAPGTNLAHGVITIPDTKSIMPHNFEYPHLIHPATLDAVFHLLFVGFTAGEPMKESAVPVLMERLFIAADCPSGAGGKYVGYTEGTLIQGRDLAGNLVLSDEQWSEPKLVINIQAREVSSNETAAGEANDIESKRTAVPEWKEDLSFMEREAVEKFLQEAGASPNLWLEHACFKDADLKALFIAGEETSDLVDLLKKHGPQESQRLRLQQCTVAAKDETVLSKLKEQLESSKINVTYQALDLAQPATEQDFAAESFDTIVAATTVQAGVELNQIVSNLKTVVAQGGRLILTGGKAAELDATYSEAGLKVAAALDDFAVAAVDFKEQAPIEMTEIVLLRRPEISATLGLALDKIADIFKARGFGVQIATMTEAHDVSGKAVISFLEAEEPLVIKWTSGDLENFKRIVSSTPYMIWITRGGQMIESENVEFAPATGMLRTVRTEVPQITLPHIDLSPSIDLTADSTLDLVVKVFDNTARETAKHPELEYVENKGKIMVCRVLESASFDRELELHSDNIKPILAPLHQEGRPLKLDVGAGGGIKGVRWVEDEEATAELGAEDVEIKTSAVCLSAQDVHAISEGQGLTVGNEATGIVSRVGSAVNKFNVGQEVALLKAGSFRTQLRQHQSLVQPIPAKMSPEAVAAIPTTFAAAYYALVDLARLSSEDKVLIEGAHTSFGQAAIQIAKSTGADIFVTTDVSADASLSDYGIAQTHIYDQASEWEPRLQRATGGIDVILSSASGKALRSLCSLVNDFGRFINVSATAEADQLTSALFQRNASFTNIDINHLLKAKSSLMSKLFKKVAELLEGEKIGVLPFTGYSVSELPAAVAALPKTHGSIVLRFDEKAVVPTAPPKPPQLSLDPAATYILSGGLGGLGPNIAQTMVDGGARHLIFVSRSGASTPEQKAVLKKLEDQGCKAEAMRCDVSDESQMARLMEQAKENNWKIKGCVQLAMVLRDTVLENMTYDKWVGATQCKIPGTWNLHSYLPTDMDFFIVFSSVVSVIGNTGQANYSAGNSYLDALAHYRRDKGMAGTSLNIGLVNDATHFTDDFTVEDFLNLYGHLVPVQVADKEVNIAIDAAMRGVTADGQAVPPQVVVGIRADLDREGSVTSLWPKDRKFDHRASTSSGAGSDGKVSLKSILTAVKTVAEAAEAVENALKSNVANSMGSTPEDVDADKPLHSFGIDSLKAVEVRNWLFREVKADVSVFEILSPTPLNSLAVKIAAKSKFIPADVAKAAEQELQD